MDNSFLGDTVKRFFSKKKEGRGFGPLNVDIKHPGPLSVAEFDCHACPATSTLLDERCRICVFDRLDVEGDLDRVALRRAYSRIYCSRDVSKLAKTFSSLKQLALDRTLYSKSDTKECKKCVDGRMHELVDETWDKLLANPHDPKPLDDLAQKQRKLKGKCAECTREYYLKLLELIKDGMKSVSTTLRLKPKNYDEVFVARVKPFFVEGIWHPPPSQARLIDSYDLSDDRGKIKIYEQPNRPVPFYELDLPEFKTPAEQLELLDEAFRIEIEEAPGQAKFAYSARMFGFADDWYDIRKARCYTPPLAWN